MKSFLSKRYLGKGVVYNFVNSMIEGNKCCSGVMKTKFNKDHVMAEEDNEKFENFTKCWICDNNYVDNDIKVRDNYHISGKYRGSAHRNCNNNLKLNYEFPIVFHNLKSYEFHLIIEEIDKFSLKINVVPNRLEKYMSFTSNNNLGFIDSFQFRLVWQRKVLESLDQQKN